MFTMQPWLRLRCGAAACDRNSGTLRLVPTRSSQYCSVISPIGVGKKLEALLTRTSRRPKRLTVSLTTLADNETFSRSAWISATESGRTAFSSACSARAASPEER